MKILKLIFSLSMLANMIGCNHAQNKDVETPIQYQTNNAARAAVIVVGAGITTGFAGAAIGSDIESYRVKHVRDNDWKQCHINNDYCHNLWTTQEDKRLFWVKTNVGMTLAAVGMGLVTVTYTIVSHPNNEKKITVTPTSQGIMVGGNF